MKKRLLLVISIMMTYTVMLNAQPCVPNSSYTSPGIYPDTAINLPHAYVGVAYSGVITAVVPADTVISGIPFPIDSMGIIAPYVVGLPTGFSWATNSTTNFWHGGTSGCLVVMGTATLAQVGTYPLTVYARGYAAGLSVPDTVFGYKLVIDTSASVTNFDNSKFALYQNSPNPFVVRTNIEFTSPVPEAYKFTVYDVIGNIVFSQTINATVGLNNFEFANAKLTSGIYMYKLSNGSSSLTRRMVIENK